MNFSKFPRTFFLTEHLRWLLLKLISIIITVIMTSIISIMLIINWLLIDKSVEKTFDLAINYIFYHGLAQANFLNFTNTLTSTSGTWSSVFVNYFEDLSAFLEIISSVREINVEMNLKAERALLSQFFAFLDPNYSCYLANRHSLLKVLCIWNILLWKRLKEIFLEVA